MAAVLADLSDFPWNLHSFVTPAAVFGCGRNFGGTCMCFVGDPLGMPCVGFWPGGSCGPSGGSFRYVYSV